MMALYLRPWILKMKENGVVARTLADDMLIITEGADHINMMERAIANTHEYLNTIGSTIAPDKNCSTSELQQSSTLVCTERLPRN